MKDLTTEQAMRYSRHILLSDFDLERQEALVNCSVLVIGVGGLGCAASQYLTASGVGRLTLVDDDKVELTNLQRQVLHTEKSVGANKVDSAQLALQQINSEVNITTLCLRPSEKQLDELIAKQDVVLDCTDNLESRNRINQICYRQSIPLVSGAAIRMEGQILCIDPRQQSACYACVSHFFGEQNLSCVESGVMSPLVGIIGAMQALEAIKLVTHYGKPLCNRLHLYDAMQATWSEFKVTRQQDFQVCGSKAKL